MRSPWAASFPALTSSAWTSCAGCNRKLYSVDHTVHEKACFPGLRLPTIVSRRDCILLTPSPPLHAIASHPQPDRLLSNPTFTFTSIDFNRLPPSGSLNPTFTSIDYTLMAASQPPIPTLSFADCNPLFSSLDCIQPTPTSTATIAYLAHLDSQPSHCSISFIHHQVRPPAVPRGGWRLLALAT